MFVLCAGVGCGASRPTPTTEVAPPPPAGLVTSVRYEPAAVEYTLVGSDVDLATLPARDWVGLPWSGRADVDARVRVALAGGALDWTTAAGALKLTCRACRIGDGVTDLPLPPGREDRLGLDRLPFGSVTFELVEIEAKIGAGGVEITRWSVASPDVVVVVTGKLAFAPRLADAQVEACVRYKPTPAFAERDPRTADVLILTGAPKAADGMYNLRVAGPYGEPRRLAQICDGSEPIRPLAVEPPPPAPDPDPNPTPADPPAPDPGAVQAALDAAIKKIDDVTYELALAAIGAILDNPAVLAGGARVVPAMKDGKPHGFKLYAIRPGSTFARLGFANGDTLVAIDGKRVDSPDLALEAYASLRGAKAGRTITVALVRGGKPLTLTYRLR